MNVYLQSIITRRKPHRYEVGTGEAGISLAYNKQRLCSECVILEIIYFYFRRCVRNEKLISICLAVAQ
jgi:hypothetical protein